MVSLKSATAVNIKMNAFKISKNLISLESGQFPSASIAMRLYIYITDASNQL